MIMQKHYKKGKTPSISGQTATKRATRKANTKRPALHTKYEIGLPILSIKYNGVDNEFVLSLVNSQNGEVVSKFHVDGSQLIGAMGMPFMALARTT